MLPGPVLASSEPPPVRVLGAGCGTCAPVLVRSVVHASSRTLASARQLTCASKACKQALHARSCKRWHRANAALARDNRVRARVISTLPSPAAPTALPDPVARINVRFLADLDCASPELEVALRAVVEHLVSVLRDEIRVRILGNPAKAAKTTSAQRQLHGFSRRFCDAACRRGTDVIVAQHPEVASHGGRRSRGDVVVLPGSFVTRGIPQASPAAGCAQLP